jgi:hypothetical protein
MVLALLQTVEVSTASGGVVVSFAGGRHSRQARAFAALDFHHRAMLAFVTDTRVRRAVEGLVAALGTGQWDVQQLARMLVTTCRHGM